MSPAKVRRLHYERPGDLTFHHWDWGWFEDGVWGILSWPVYPEEEQMMMVTLT